MLRLEMTGVREFDQVFILLEVRLQFEYQFHQSTAHIQG